MFGIEAFFPVVVIPAGGSYSDVAFGFSHCESCRMLQVIDFGHAVIRLKVVEALVQGCSEDVYLVEVALAYACFIHSAKVHDAGGVEAHYLRCEGIGGEGVGAGEGNFCIEGCTSCGAFAFHRLEAVDDGEVGVDFLSEVEHIVVQDGVDCTAGSMGENFVVAVVVADG